MLVCMTVLLRTMGVTMRVIMRVSMRVSMVVMRVVMRMAVARLSFASTRKVVDELNRHQLSFLALSDLFVVSDPARWQLAMKRSLVGYSSDEEPPKKRQVSHKCFRDSVLTFSAENYRLSPHPYCHLLQSITPHCTKVVFAQHLMSMASSQLTCMYRCLWVAIPCYTN